MPSGPAGRRRLLPLLLAAVLPLAGCGGPAPAAQEGAQEGAQQGPVTGVVKHDADNLHGVVLAEPYRAADVTLRDTAGHSYDLATDPDRPLTLVFFGYTHCPDICQVVMATLASALVRLDPEQRSEVDMVFVTSDPARDTAPVLRSYVDRFDPTFEGLTGPLPAVERAGTSLGVMIEKGKKLASGGYDVGHGTQVVGLLPDGTAPYVWPEGSSPADLASDVSTILDGGVRTR